MLLNTTKKIRNIKKAYRDANKDRKKEYNRQYREQNKDSIAEQTKL